MSVSWKIEFDRFIDDVRKCTQEVVAWAVADIKNGKPKCSRTELQCQLARYRSVAGISSKIPFATLYSTYEAVFTLISNVSNEPKRSSTKASQERNRRK